VADNLRENGATEDEIEFLLDKRVELNAFASDQLVDWIERKLKEHDIAKVVPDDETLADAYQRMRRQAAVQEHIDKALADLGEEDEAMRVPADLRTRIEAAQQTDPDKRWDDVLRQIADGDHGAAR
jgi:DNA repair ATPase RecN